MHFHLTGAVIGIDGGELAAVLHPACSLVFIRPPGGPAGPGHDSTTRPEFISVNQVRVRQEGHSFAHEIILDRGREEGFAHLDGDAGMMSYSCSRKFALNR